MKLPRGPGGNSVNHCLLDEVVQQRLQTLLDILLIIKCATEQGSFERLVRAHGRIQLGVNVGCAACVQKLLTTQSGNRRIRSGNDFIDQAVHTIQAIFLVTIADGENG